MAEEAFCPPAGLWLCLLYCAGFSGLFSWTGSVARLKTAHCCLARPSVRPSVCLLHILFFQSGIRSTHLSQVVKCVSHLSGIPNS